jgi:AhpD family alkylhydroperoxidase
MTAGAPPPRLPLVGAPENPSVKDVFERLEAGSGLLNLHRMMAHAPALMQASGAFAGALRRDTLLDRGLAELVVLRTAQAVACDYVWTRHLPLARDCGISEQQIKDLAHWPDSAAFAARDKAALGFAETIAAQSPVRDETFAALERQFSPREIVEITMLVGFYVSTAILIKALAVPPETG